MNALNAEEAIDIGSYVRQCGERARQVSRELAALPTGPKNHALYAIADSLEKHSTDLIAKNRIDLEAGRARQLSDALLDRLGLDQKRISAMADGLRQIATLPDPVGEISEIRQRPSGIRVGRMRVPIGVIGIIYESRPNVTADAAALCLKSGNAVILRGGSEAINSNLAIADCISDGLEAAGISADAIQVLKTKDRLAVGSLLKMPEFVDVIVPRGGKGLIERISNDARVPVIKHLDGVCHVYIDQGADQDMAEAIAVNAKTQRYGTCNTMETLLVNATVAESILPKLAQAYAEKKVEMRGCAVTCSILGEACLAATGQDWDTEYLAPILSIRVVEDLDAAIEHINIHSSQHTESIISENITKARRFLREVDSSSVMVNASTRFADGFEYGLGAEIGISTDKFHARGPVGLEGLTSVKYVVLGDGHIRR